MTVEGVFLDFSKNI